MHNSDSLVTQNLGYKYTLTNEFTQEKMWERDPNRMLKIKDPSLYTKKSNIFHKFISKFIINGYLKKDDINFREAFHITKLGKTDIYIGSCP